MKVLDVPPVGSDFDGYKEMFNRGPVTVSEALQDSTVAKRWEERNIPTDIDARFNQTLESKGFTLITEVSEGLKYPDITSWIEFRLVNDRGTKFFPAFVQNESGNRFFMKYLVTNNENANNVFDTELSVLNALPSTVKTPPLLALQTPTESEHGYFVFEAIPFTEASVTPPHMWESAHVSSAIQQIKDLEKVNLSELREQHPDSTSLTRKADVAQSLKGKLEQCAAALDAEVQVGIEKLLEVGNVPEVFIHGDVTIKNILAGYDGAVTLIDWEMGGTGFMGQDAGKLYSGLQARNPEDAEQVAHIEQLKEQLIREYVYDDNGNLDTARAHAFFTGLVAENMLHYHWRVGEITRLESKGVLDQDDHDHIAIYKAEMELFQSRMTKSITAYNQLTQTPQN